VIGPNVLAVVTSGRQCVGGHHDRDGDHGCDARGRGYPSDRPYPSREGSRRVREPGRFRRRRAGPGAPSRARHLRYYAGVVHAVRDRGVGQPGSEAADRRVHLLGLGGHVVRERGGQAPPGQPRPGRDRRRGDPDRAECAGDHRPPRRGHAGRAAGRCYRRAGVHGAGHRRPAMRASWHSRSPCRSSPRPAPRSC
jgi:hypothetical protein